MADTELEYALALSLREHQDKEIEQTDDTLIAEVKKRSDPRSILDAYWELADPHPNISELFTEFDAMFFNTKLAKNGTDCKWSDKMILCAGVCSYEEVCTIYLSEPLLKQCYRRDLVETLLHEMIHAYLFVTENSRDHDGHGPQFLSHMNRINELTGANITVHHSFHPETNQCRQHWWKCNGPCQHRPPFYGLVKRAVNRAPSPDADRWWAEHQLTCGGTFTKFKELGMPKMKDGSRVSKGKGSGHESLLGTPHVAPFIGIGRTISPSRTHRVALSPREKMLEAAERRREMNQNRGIIPGKRRRKIFSSDSPVKLSSASGASPTKTPSHRSPAAPAFSQSPPANKRARVQAACDGIETSSHDYGDCVFVKYEKDIVLDLTGHDGPGGTHDNSDNELPGPSGYMKSSRLGDQDPRMCPVCGRVDIPAAIINGHVAFCLSQ